MSAVDGTPVAEQVRGSTPVVFRHDGQQRARISASNKGPANTEPVSGW